MLSIFRYAQAARAFLRLVRDMHRTDEVFEVVNGLDSPKVMQPIANHLASQPGGQVALESKPRVGGFDLKALGLLPAGSLGKAYADHMTGLGLDPYFFPQMKVENELDYMRVHLYETHDIWHVVTGFTTDVAGELGLQAFYAAQLNVGFLPPVLLAAGLLNAALFDINDLSRRMDAIAIGWRMGKTARPFFGQRWGSLWDRPLDEIRAALAVEAAPVLPAAAPVPEYGVAVG